MGVGVGDKQGHALRVTPLQLHAERVEVGVAVGVYPGDAAPLWIGAATLNGPRTGCGLVKVVALLQVCALGPEVAELEGQVFLQLAVNGQAPLLIASGAVVGVDAVWCKAAGCGWAGGEGRCP